MFHYNIRYVTRGISGTKPRHTVIEAVDEMAARDIFREHHPDCEITHLRGMYLVSPTFVQLAVAFRDGDYVRVGGVEGVIDSLQRESGDGLSFNVTINTGVRRNRYCQDTGHIIAVEYVMKTVPVKCVC